MHSPPIFPAILILSNQLKSFKKGIYHRRVPGISVPTASNPGTIYAAWPSRHTFCALSLEKRLLRGTLTLTMLVGVQHPESALTLGDSVMIRQFDAPFPASGPTPTTRLPSTTGRTPARPGPLRPPCCRWRFMARPTSGEMADAVAGVEAPHARPPRDVHGRSSGC